MSRSSVTVMADPVCGRSLTEVQALLRSDYEGRTYLFCSERCRMLFSLRPGDFAVETGSLPADDTPE
jgi:YHS domain-containing protein